MMVCRCAFSVLIWKFQVACGTKTHIQMNDSWFETLNESSARFCFQLETRTQANLRFQP